MYGDLSGGNSMRLSPEGAQDKKACFLNSLSRFKTQLSFDFNVEAEKEFDDEDDSFDINNIGLDDENAIIKAEETKKED